MAGEKSATYSGQLLALLFNATTIPNVAINATSAPLTNLYVALHSADPTATGNQTTNEIAYTPYARVAVARTTGGWVISGASASPVANIIFPTPSGTPSATATFFSVGSAASGAGTIFYTGPISPSIVVTTGLPPTLTPATTATEA
jgi:hypothetical protein